MKPSPELILLLIIHFWMTPVATFAQNHPLAHQPFQQAIESASPKTVTILGAGIGREKGYASGIFVSENGHILTANGVLLLSDTLRVMTDNGKLFTAKIIKTSKRLQCALLKINTTTPAFFSLSDEKHIARQGDWILVLSNTFKVAGRHEKLSANMGVVTLRSTIASRHRTQDDPYSGDLLMYDAISNNPGSPGAAVINIEGQLAGMAGKLLQAQSTQTRLNYAIPTDQLHTFMHSTKYDDSEDAPVHMLEKGTLGIVLFRLGGTRSPAFVERVLPDSPASLSELKADDMIISVNGKAIRSLRDFDTFADSIKVNQSISLTIKRGGRILEKSLVATKLEN